MWSTLAGPPPARFRGISMLLPNTRRHCFPSSSCDLHAQEIHIEVSDLLIIVHLIRDVVDVEGLERLARGPGCRRHPGCRGCRRKAQALNELPPVHFSLFEILEQFCDDTFHCLSSYSEVRRD